MADVYTPSFTLAHLSALEMAIVSGVTTVSYEGKSTTYRTLDDMFRIRKMMQIALGIAPSRSSTILVSHDRGIPASDFPDDLGSGL